MGKDKEDEIRILKHLKGCVKNQRVKFPSGISFQWPKSDVIKMHIGKDGNGKPAVSANMQTDAAAFEGWALVLKAHIGELRKVVLTWEVARNRDDKHYQRFLYRVDRFRRAFQDWFVCDQPYTQRFGICNDQPDGHYKLNVPGKARARIPSTEWGERWIEWMLVNDKEFSSKFKRQAALSVLGNQLPVGVFEVEVKRGKDVFTSQASAIDLWGVNSSGDELSLFELKKPGNAKVGAISEVFFYAMVMKDVISGRFAFGGERCVGVDPWPPDHISGRIRRIKAYLLVDQLHCLVGDEVFNMLNRAFESQDISFGYFWPEVLMGRKEQ